MTDTGCQQCGVNTFSEDGASSCTKCPDGKISPAGSTSQDDCYFGKNINTQYVRSAQRINTGI